MTNSSAHHHSCGLPAPACPQAPPSLIPPASSHSPFLEQRCIIRSPPPLCSPNTPTCPFWFSASSWSVSRAKSNRCVWDWPARGSGLPVQPPPWSGLSLSWAESGCPLSRTPHLHPSRAWVKKCSDAFAFWPFLCLFSCNPLFFFSYSNIPSPSLLLVFCSIFYFKKFCLINQTRETSKDYVKKKKKRRQPHLLLKLVLKFKFSKIHKRHHNRPETNQKKNNRWSFFTAARPSPGSSRCHFLPSFLSQWHAKFMVILRSRYPCKQTSLIFLYNWLILLTPTYLSAWGWVEKSSN